MKTKHKYQKNKNMDVLKNIINRSGMSFYVGQALLEDYCRTVSKISGEEEMEIKKRIIDRAVELQKLDKEATPAL